MTTKISTRQHEILKLLLEHKAGLTIDEIALALNISRNAVMQHFIGLENKGYLRQSALTKTAGRPVSTYSLTELGINYFPKQYAWFAELILTELKQSLGDEAFIGYLQKLADTLADKLQPQFAARPQLIEKIEFLIKTMSELGFQVQLENADAHTALIQANNCIYHDLAQKHTEVCEFDKTLINSLLKSPVEQISCMAKGEYNCVFKISKL